MSYLLDIWRTFNNSDMIKHIQYHIDNRYRTIEKRVIDTIDYVEPSYDNRFTYSFHYASILRDIGSCFDSTISEIIVSEKLNYPKKIGGFLKFLKKFEKNLKYVECSVFNTNEYIYPFKLEENGLPGWWNAYNDVKHNEILSQFSGNQLNVFTGLSALYILKRAVSSAGSNIFIITNIPSIHGNNQFRKEFFSDT